MALKTVLETLPCPRCNADSQKRIEEQEKFLAVIHVCPMCRYRRSLGITTRRAINLQTKLNRYNELLNESNKINEKHKILAKIKRVEKLLRKEQLGIGA